MIHLQFKDAVIFRPRKPSPSLAREMDRYIRTGVISKELLKESAPFLNDSARNPPCLKAFPGQIE